MSKLGDMFREFEEQEQKEIKPEKIVQKPIIAQKKENMDLIESPSVVIEPIKGNLYEKIKEKFTGSSDFDRALVGAIDDVLPGLINRKVLRQSKEKMIPNINRGIKRMRQKLNIVEKLREKYTPVYRECMNELKMELAKRKAKIEDQ